jgi:hypothetical protein
MRNNKKQFTYSVRLKSERLELVELNPKMNFDNYLKWVNDLSNKQFLATANVTYSREQLITYVQDIYTDENTVLWGIFVKDSHIGNLKAMRNSYIQRIY